MTVTRWALTPGYWTSPGLDPVASTAAGDGYAPKPDAQNTGPAASVTLTEHSGNYTATDDISAMHITGSLTVDGDDITVTDCQIDGSILPNGGSSGSYPIQSGQKFIRCSATGVWSTGGDGLVFDACHFGTSETTFMQIAGETSGSNYLELKNVTIKNCLFDNLLDSTGEKHTEAIHVMDAHTILIQNCVFDFGRNADAATKAQISEAVNIDNFENSTSDMTFDHNWLYGGGVYQMGFNPTGTNSVTNNAFHGYSSNSVVYPQSNWNAYTQSGNTLDGDPITLPD